MNDKKYLNIQKNELVFYNCYFKLRSLSEEKITEDDIDIYNDMLEEIEKRYDDKMDNIDGYWYIISNISERDLDILTDLFEDTEEKLDDSYISYDFADIY